MTPTDLDYTTIRNNETLISRLLAERAHLLATLKATLPVMKTAVRAGLDFRSQQVIERCVAEHGTLVEMRAAIQFAEEPT